MPAQQLRFALVTAAALLGPGLPAQADERADPAVLLRDLQHAKSWIRQCECARALAASGVADDKVLAALLGHMRTSEVPALRAECLDAYATLRPTAVRDLLTAVARGDFAEVEYAADAIERLGDAATAALVDEVRNNGAAAAVATSVLLRRGWLDVPELERVALHDLAERALFAGALHLCAGAEETDRLRARLARTPSPIARLPVIEWVDGFGHGPGFVLCRAAEVERGLLVTSIALREPRDGPAVAVVQSTLLPREDAHAMARQLAVLPCVEWVPVDAPNTDTSSSWISFSNFIAVARATVGDDVLFDAAFCGYPAADNVAQRFVPEVASKVLAATLHGARWETREPTDADRAFVAAIGSRLPKEQTWWTLDRLERLRGLLAPR